MRFRYWPSDTIAWRLALTIASAVVVTLVSSALLLAITMVISPGPPIQETGFLERADVIVRIIEAAPPSQRQVLAKSAGDKNFHTDWYPDVSPVAKMLSSGPKPSSLCDLPQFKNGNQESRAVCFDLVKQIELPADLRFDTSRSENVYFLGIPLSDASWIVFSAPSRFWTVTPIARIASGVALTLVAIIIFSALAGFQLSRPISEFAKALSRFGTDPRASPIPERGPSELRATIAAFNAMQAQIQKFVDDRTTVLAAISHDLRTPLTRMRLRGEFIVDEYQRQRLFHDIDEMTAMVESALSLFREDFRDEQTTAFDMPALLRTVADDVTDQGTRVSYIGPERAVFRGRPFALKRAISNLVENAVKYGEEPEIELNCSPEILLIFVRDRGPGIPVDAAEQVFAPFFRLERSRNRSTGGAGLGLTSARAVIRGHGGNITICNRQSGGLEVSVTLPIAP